MGKAIKTHLDKAFTGLKFGGFPQKCNLDPPLHGFWGGGIMTMTEQAIRHGIPSFQLEIPLAVRRLLYKEPKYADHIANMLYDIYS